MSTTEAAILERLIEPAAGEQSPEVARYFLSLDFRGADRQRLQDLTAKAAARSLSPGEQAELDAYNRVSQLLARVQVRARHALESREGPCEVAPGIRRSQEAFWRDLPQLLRKRRDHGKWVAYHGDERIGVAYRPQELVRAIVQRGIPDDAYYMGVIRPHDLPPWEPDDIEPIHPQPFESIAPGS